MTSYSIPGGGEATTVAYVINGWFFMESHLPKYLLSSSRGEFLDIRKMDQGKVLDPWRNICTCITRQQIEHRKNPGLAWLTLQLNVDPYLKTSKRACICKWVGKKCGVQAQGPWELHFYQLNSIWYPERAHITSRRFTAWIAVMIPYCYKIKRVTNPKN